MKERLLFFCAFLWLGIVALSAASLTLEWDPNPAEEQITSYVVKQKEGEGWKTIGQTSETSFVIEDISPGVYTFAVAASNVWGESILSEAITTTPAPTQPKAFKVQITIQVLPFEPLN